MATISIDLVPHLLGAIHKATGICTDVIALQMRRGNWLMLEVQDDTFEGQFDAVAVAKYIAVLVGAKLGVHVEIGADVVSEGSTIGLQIWPGQTPDALVLQMAGA